MANQTPKVDRTLYQTLLLGQDTPVSDHRNRFNERIPRGKNIVRNLEVFHTLRLSAGGSLSKYMVVDIKEAGEYREVSVLRLLSIHISAKNHDLITASIGKDEPLQLNMRIYGVSDHYCHTKVEDTHRFACTCSGCGDVIPPDQPRIVLQFVRDRKQYIMLSTSRGESRCIESFKQYLHVSTADCRCGGALLRRLSIEK